MSDAGSSINMQVFFHHIPQAVRISNITDITVLKILGKRRWKGHSFTGHTATVPAEAEADGGVKEALREVAEH